MNATVDRLTWLRRTIASVILLSSFAAAAGWYWGRQVDLPNGVSADDYALIRAAVAKSGVPDVESAVWLELGSWSFQRKDFSASRECYRRIPTGRAEAGVRARALEGETCFLLGLATEAEGNFREAISHAETGHFESLPEWDGSYAWLRNVLEIELRYEERHQLLKTRHQGRLPEFFDTAAWCFPSLLRWNGAESVAKLEMFYAATPQDYAVRLALARYRTGAGRLDEALEVVVECLRERPDDLAAIAALLELYHATGDWESMRAVVDQLPAVAHTDPWLLLLMRGHLLHHDDRWTAAEACYRTLLEIDESQAEAHTGLARTLRGQGRHKEAQDIEARAAILGRIQSRLGAILERPAIEPMIEIANMCHELRMRRQCTWTARQALRLDPQNKRVRELLQQMDDDRQ